MKPLTNLEIFEKQTAVFECEVSKANQTAKWFQAGTEVVNMDRFTPEVDGKVHRLTITNGQLDDTFKYSCIFEKDNKKTSAKLLVKGANRSLSAWCDVKVKSYVYVVITIEKVW